MGLKVSNGIWVVLAIAGSLIVGGKLVLDQMTQTNDGPTTALRGDVPQSDLRTVQDMIPVRFAGLTFESVAEECNQWVTENKWTFGRTLSQLRDEGTETSDAEVAVLFRSFRATQIQQYAKLTKDPEAARPAVTALLDEWVDRADEGTADSVQQLQKLTVAALAAGSTDPLVKTLQLSFQPTEDYSKVADSVAKLPEQVSAAGYDSYFRLLAQHSRFKLGAASEAINLGPMAFELIDDVVAYSDEFSADRNLTRVTWYNIFLAYMPPLRDSEREELLRQLMISEKTDPLYLHLLIGHSFQQKAGQLRGGGFIDTVAEESREEIDRLFSSASTHQTKAWLLRPDLPHAATAMIELAMANPQTPNNWNERQWLELSCRAQFDYVTAYRVYLKSLLPRWGGNYLDILKFGKECADTRAFETSIPFFLIDCVNSIAAETPNGTTWQTSTYVDTLTEFWDTLDKWADDNGNDRSAPQWQLQYSLKAAVMIRNRRFKEAQDALERADWPPTVEVMQNVISDPLFGASMAYGIDGPKAEELTRIEKTYGATIPEDATPEDLKKAISILDAAKKESTTARADRYLSARTTSLKQQLAFINDEWVNLTFEEPLTNWIIRGGRATIESPTTLLMSNLEFGQTSMYATPNVRFRAPFVVKATLERIRGDRFIPRLGINVGPVSEATVLAKKGSGMVFLFDDQPRVAGTMNPGRQPQIYYIPELQDSAKLMIIANPDSYTMFINDVEVPIKQTNFRPNGELSFGGNPFETAMGQIRLSDVQVHQIHPDETEADAAAAAQ